MTLVLQRLLLSAAVLICLTDAGTTTIGKGTPSRATSPTTTLQRLIEETTRRITPARTTTGVSPARLDQTPSRPSTTGTTGSRRPTPAQSATSTVSPAKLDQTPTRLGPSVSSTSMRPTPTTTTTASQSVSTRRSTPQEQVVSTVSSSVSMRPTPTRGGSSTGSVSRVETPSSNGPTSFMSQQFSTPTSFVTQFNPQSATTMMTQPIPSSSPTSFMSQPGGSTSFGMSSSSSSMGLSSGTGSSSGGAGNMTTGGGNQGDRKSVV